MKIDRRSFLGLGLGAVAGVTVSPVTWKLTDDSSIWTQNWPWTPVPKDGKVTFDKTVCSLCDGNCGISVRKIAGRPVKIEGTEDYPVNQGGVCLHGLSALQYLYDPSRIKGPMAKKGDTWQEISWDEALKQVCGNLNKLREDKEPEKLACISKTDKGTIPGLFNRFLMACGSNNFVTMESMTDTWQIVISRMHNMKGVPGFDLENADCILSFGSGLIEGWGSPVHNFKVNASRKERGALLFQVEPRLSNTAASADHWIPARPGTEADLALGICSIMITRNLYNSLFIAGLGNGFEQFAKHVTTEYSPARTAEITGVKAEKIEEIAKTFAKSKTGVAIAGRGRGENAGSLREFSAVHALNCLKGNINKKGGVWIVPDEEFAGWPAVDMDETASRGFGEKRLDQAGSSTFPDINSSASTFFAQINASSTPPVKTLFVYDANPCYAMKDTKAVKEAVKKIPFVVSFSSFMDETAQMADLILPSHMFLERIEDLPGSAMMPQKIVGLSKPVIDPVFNTKNPGDTIIMMAKAMGGALAANFPWKGYESCLENVAGEMWGPLSKKGYVLQGENPPDMQPFVDFACSALTADRIAAQGDDSFSITLIPYDNVRIAAGTLQSSPFAVKTVSDKVLKNNDGFIEINPVTAEKLNLSQGDYAALSTPRGKAKVKVHLSEGIMPGVAAMAAGLGHTGENRYVAGKGINVNELLGPVKDSGSGLDAAFGIKAKISRA